MEVIYCFVLVSLHKLETSSALHIFTNHESQIRVRDKSIKSQYGIYGYRYIAIIIINNYTFKISYINVLISLKITYIPMLMY